MVPVEVLPPPQTPGPKVCGSFPREVACLFLDLPPAGKGGEASHWPGSKICDGDNVAFSGCGSG